MINVKRTSVQMMVRADFDYVLVNDDIDQPIAYFVHWDDAMVSAAALNIKAKTHNRVKQINALIEQRRNEG